MQAAKKALELEDNLKKRGDTMTHEERAEHEKQLKLLQAEMNAKIKVQDRGSASLTDMVSTGAFEGDAQKQRLRAER